MKRRNDNDDEMTPPDPLVLEEYFCLFFSSTGNIDRFVETFGAGSMGAAWII
jgi:hypothetical protein